MKSINIRERLNDSEVELIVKLVKEGLVFIYPTDTVYGLGCTIHSKNVRKIFEIKQRSEELPLSVAFSSLGMVRKYSSLSEKDEVFIKKRLDGPYTFVVKKKSEIPDIVTAGRDTVGIRIFNNELIGEIIENSGTPIITTSANISGTKPPVSVDEISPTILNGVDFVVDSGPCRIGRPSKVVDLVVGKVLRE